MATQVFPLKRTGNPALAIQNKSAPRPMEKGDFRNLINLRRTLLLNAASARPSALQTFAADPIRSLLNTPGLPPAAVIELSKAIAAQRKAREEAEAARVQALLEVESAISAYQKQYRTEAREAWQEYSEALKEKSADAEVYRKEVELAAARIEELKSECS